jgi:hypothetical protein
MPDEVCELCEAPEDCLSGRCPCELSGMLCTDGEWFDLRTWEDPCLGLIDV